MSGAHWSETDGPVIVAEAGQTHEGNIDKAHDLIDAAAEAGAWAIKFQLLQPDTIAAPFAPKYWEHGDSLDQRGVFARNGVLPYDAHIELAEHADSQGIALIGTPFDVDAVDTLAKIGNPIKVASGDITNVSLLRAVADTGLPVILSTGAARVSEIGHALKIIGHDDVILLACSLEYPTPPHHAALGRIAKLKATFDTTVGYSDHTLGVWAAGPAVACGAKLLEKHFTLGGSVPVPDHEMSVDADGLAAYVDLAETSWDACSISRLAPHEGEAAARVGARRSWYATADIEPGDVFSEDNALPLRPWRADAVDASIEMWGLKSAGVRAGAPVTHADIDNVTHL
jgi:N-acetylneuraminate synthase/N,N'-diacetyllegionaminate synthase